MSRSGIGNDGWDRQVLRDALRMFRLRARMSQTELARRAGVHTSYIMRLEKGERENPRLDKVLLIARALELNERQTNHLLDSANYAPLPELRDYDGRYWRRGWGSRSNRDGDR